MPGWTRYNTVGQTTCILPRSDKVPGAGAQRLIEMLDQQQQHIEAQTSENATEPVLEVGQMYLI